MSTPASGTSDEERPDGIDGFSAAMEELEAILAEIEDQDVDVDVLSRRVERAAELIRFCRSRISAAGMRVEEIVADLGDQAV